MPRWLPDSFDADAHNARVRSQRSQMREQEAAHRIQAKADAAHTPGEYRRADAASSPPSTSGGVECRHAARVQQGTGHTPTVSTDGAITRNLNEEADARHCVGKLISPLVGVAPDPLTSSPVADAATRKGAGPLTPPQRRPNSADGAPIYPLVGMCRAAGLPEPVPEYQFHHARKWRLDFAWPLQRIGIEIEGGIWSGGRHTRGSGFVGDMAKYNAATMLGWRLLRYAPDQLGQALGDLRIMFAGDAA